MIDPSANTNKHRELNQSEQETITQIDAAFGVANDVMGLLERKVANGNVSIDLKKKRSACRSLLNGFIALKKSVLFPDGEPKQ